VRLPRFGSRPLVSRGNGLVKNQPALP
jgi:hypothetical protein